MPRHLPKLGRSAVNKEEQTRRVPCFAHLSATSIPVGWVERSETHRAMRRLAITGYRRNFVVNLAGRRLPLLTQHIQALRAASRYARHRHPFAIDAIVLLPDHLHAIWTLPEGEADFAVRWQLIKATFSRSLPGGKGCRGADPGSASAASGSAAIGSTRCAMKRISHGTPITSTSSMTMSGGCGIGHTRLSIDWRGLAFMRRIG